MLDTKESKCTSCGAPYKLGQRFCKYCGAQLGNICNNCGVSLGPDAKFCTKCGVSVTRSPKEKVPAVLKSNSLAPSLLPLLIVMLVFLVVGIGGLIYWQLGQDRSRNAMIKIWDIKVAHIGQTSVTIEWKTDVLSGSQVEYGRSKQYGSLAPLEPKNDPSTQKSTGVTSHSILVLNLNTGTRYHFRVRAMDADGNETVSDVDRTFKTKTRDERFRWDF